MPFDIDVDDASFWLHFTPEQVRELERRLELTEPRLPPGTLQQPVPPRRMVGAQRGAPPPEERG